ncbi:MAG TPA: thioredoxin family protein [Planctomycetota bacterium]|nr:thioredoxin family protein [Planctomycetota bacterium]
MKSRPIAVVILIVAGMSFPCFAAGDETAVGPPSAAQDRPTLMDDAYPGLASEVLTYARLVDLPEGMLLRSGDLTIRAEAVKAEIARAPELVQEQLRQQAIFVLERIAAKDLLLLDAKSRIAKTGTDVAQRSEQEIMKKHFGTVVEKITVTDQEVADFYRNNSEMFQGAKLDEVKPQLARYLLQQKQEDAVNRHVKTLGQRMTVEVSASWVKAKAVLAMDNPVDKVRQSGRPSLVDFGRGGCGPCDMMTPILEELKKKYDGKANVLFVHVGEEQILAARYGIRAIPEQVFFDKDGREMFRHTGFFPKDQIEKRLAELGVK